MSRTAIADAALAVGFEHMTVTAVARRLGVSHAGLYGHVRDRGDLVRAAVDRLVEVTSWPEPTGDWRAFLEAEAWALWGMLIGHPGLTEAAGTIAGAPTGLASRVSVVAAHLLTLGFAADDALVAADTVFDLALDTASRGAQLTRMTAADRHDMARRLAADADPRLRAAGVEALTEDPARWFAKKLRVVLTGIGACLAPTPTVSSAGDAADGGTGDTDDTTAGGADGGTGDTAGDAPDGATGGGTGDTTGDTTGGAAGGGTGATTEDTTDDRGDADD